MQKRKPNMPPMRKIQRKEGEISGHLPILLDELYVFDHKFQMPIRIDFSYDLFHKIYRQKIAYYSPSGDILHMSTNSTIDFINLTSMDYFVTPLHPKRELILHFDGEVEKCFFTLNPYDPRQIFFKIGNRYSGVIKEKIDYNCELLCAIIIGVGVAIGGWFVGDAVSDASDEASETADQFFEMMENGLELDTRTEMKIEFDKETGLPFIVIENSVKLKSGGGSK